MMKTFQLPARPLRRKSKGESETHNSESVCTSMVEQQFEKSFRLGAAQEKRKHIRKLPDLLRRKFPKKHEIPKNVDSTDTPVILDFNQNLEQNRLAEASQQLLAQEEQLFRLQSSDEEVICTEDEEDSLQKDYEILMLRLWFSVHDSFNMNNQERLKSAIKAIWQQEEQDRRWEEASEMKHPRWRPLKCREVHDRLLKELVDVRLEQTNEEDNAADKLSTSLKREVCRMGRRIQKDLLHVVRDVQQCYTPEFDICNMYANLFHQAVSTKLLELAQTDIELQDCIYMLYFINSVYPKDILQQKELKPHINVESLSALLPDEERKSLEEKYLSHKEGEVRKWLSNALKKEEEVWQMNKPELIDGCFISNLALDVIPIFDGVMQESVNILGNSDNSQRIPIQLENFLVSYKKSMAEIIKGRHISIPDIMKANLVCIKQLRDYIARNEHLSDDITKNLLAILLEMRNSCHNYFLSPKHKELKVLYRKLWTPVWFSKSHEVVGDLLSIVDNGVQDLSDLQSTCKKELLNQLHSEVMIEYVRRMMKGKLRLRNKDEQEAAACFMCEDSVRINSLFIKSGSEENWLCSILPKVSEVVRLQDPGVLQLEMVTLARTYPDISEGQVLALLDLKANLSRADVRSIRQSLTENREQLNSEPKPAFFCKVPAKRKLTLTMINN